MTKFNSIFEYVRSAESAMAVPVSITDGFEWKLLDHVRNTVLYKNSQLESGKNKGMADEKPVKNIILPIIRLQYRTEGFDVKDIEMFVDDAKNYYKSFLVKKYHTKWARENGLDTFIDQLVESYVDFGGALVKRTSSTVPEVVPLQSIAFCDQTDLLGGPIGFKHYYSPDRLKEMAEFGWGDEANGATISIESLIMLSENTKDAQGEGATQNKTPGQYIELYEVHGTLPDSFVDGEPDEYSLQMHIVGYYTDETGTKQGISLFSKRQKELPFKVLLRDEIYGRALGLGGVEELTEPQVWVNFSQIMIKELLVAASKVVHVTDDPAFVARNPNIEDIKNNEVLERAPGTSIGQLDTTPRNLNLFENWVREMELHGQQIGAAYDPLLGAPAPSGSTFRGQERQVIEGKGIHDYRRGKIATFVDKLYQDWFIVDFKKAIASDKEFLAELSTDELQEIGLQIAENIANKNRNEQVLNGELPEDKETLKQELLQGFIKGGNKKFIKFFKEDFKDAPISVRLNIAGKQAYLEQMVDRLTGVIQQLFNPQVLQSIQQNPGLGKPFNEILERQGLSPIQFAGLLKMPEVQIPQQIPQVNQVVTPQLANASI